MVRIVVASSCDEQGIWGGSILSGTTGMDTWDCYISGNKQDISKKNYNFSMNNMKLVLKIISYTGLGLTIIPSILFLMDKIELSQLKLYMFIGVFVWFGSAVFWVGKGKK